MKKPKLYCIVGKTCSGKDYIGQKISNIYNIPKIAVSDIIKNFCKQNNIAPTREDMIKLGNSPELNGQAIAAQVYNILSGSGIITGIRKPETISELQKVFDTTIIGVIANDNIRYERYVSRLSSDNQKDIYKTFDQFINDEKAENSWPNKQSVQMILNMSDRYIHNPSPIYRDVDESIDRMINHMKYQPIYDFDDDHYRDQQGYKHFARAIIYNQYGQILLFEDSNKGYAILPGGKLDKGENPEQAIKRELSEELGITNIDKTQYLGGIGGHYPDGLNKGHYFHIWTNDIIKNLEPHKQKIGYYYSSLLSPKTHINTGIYHYENNGRFDHLDLTKSNDHLHKIHRI